MMNLYTIFNIMNMEEENSLMQQERRLLDFAKQKLAILLKKESKKGMSQKYLGKILGIEQCKISYAMKAKSSISLSRIIGLIGKLGQDVVIDTRKKGIEKIFIVMQPTPKKPTPKKPTPKNPTHIMEHWASKNII